jgi:hypothetical protein
MASARRGCGEAEKEKKWLEEEGEPDRWGLPVGDRREAKSWWAAGRETCRKRREVGLLG